MLFVCMANEFIPRLDESAPRPELRDPALDLRVKTHLLGRYLQGEMPPDDAGAQMIGRSSAIIENQIRMTETATPIQARIRDHLDAPGPFDRFGSYEIAEELALSTLNNNGTAENDASAA